MVSRDSDGVRPTEAPRQDEVSSTSISSPGSRDDSELPVLPTPLPKVQLGVLLYLQLAEPITSFLVLPFINQLVLDYGLTGGDAKRVGYYAGTIMSCHYIAEMAFVFSWGRLSDRIGRRTVVLIGFAGLSVAIIAFGLFRSFVGLALCRLVGGALNGHAGVMKSMMAELTDESNRARAFGLLPFVYAVGLTISPLIGGSLSHPYERFPKVFGDWILWKNYPYLLPCLVAATFPIMAFILAATSLEETLKRPANAVRTTTYGTTSSSSLYQTGPTGAANSTRSLLVAKTRPEPPPLRSIMTTGVRMAVLNYGSVALLSSTFTFILSLFLSTSISSGGLGLPPPIIGLVLGISGIWNGLFSALFFAMLHRRFGTNRLFTLSISMFIVLYALWPIMGVLARRGGEVSVPVIILLAAQQAIAPFPRAAYTCSNIFLTSAAPSRLALGATVGLGQTVASFMRGVGPAASASLFAVTMQRQLLGGFLVYLVLILLVLVAVGCATLLPAVVKRSGEESDEIVG